MYSFRKQYVCNTSKVMQELLSVSHLKRDVKGVSQSLRKITFQPFKR